MARDGINLAMLRMNRFACAMTMATTLATGAACLGAGAVVSAAVAQEPQLVAEHGDWAAYAYDTDKGKVCYVVSQPSQSRTEPPGRARDPMYFLVTHRPAQGIRNEVSTIIGYPFQKGSDAELTIGSDAFKLFTSGDGAWVDDSNTERKIVEAMKRGATMTVKGVSWRGTTTYDQYSLSGLTAALEEIDKTCGS